METYWDQPVSVTQETILWQLVGRNDWDIVEHVLTAAYVIEHMPPKMRLTTELRCRGHSILSISHRLHISPITVRRHLCMAKKRICTAIL